MRLPETLLNAVSSFGRLPGVGEKTALRQSLFLSTLNREELLLFGESIKALADLRKCQDCGMFCDDQLCSICTDHSRYNCKTLCVVESVTDGMAIEKSGQFRGKLHVLGGVLNPLLGIGPDELSISQLVGRVQKENFSEIILALNPSVEGDATCSYIKQVLEDLKLDECMVERIGFGIPIGGSLEYLDSLTITTALENRRKL